jgi:hypothetical protein
MSAIFHDIHEHLGVRMQRHRVKGANYDEVLYADDTIIISKDTRSINLMLRLIEQERRKYGMKLNKTKCETVAGRRDHDIHFENGVKVPALDEVKYLGCRLNKDCDVTREVKARTAVCVATLKQLDLLWRHSNCPVRFKLQALDAVIQSKLLNGLESAQLNQGTVDKLDVFQLKGLRKILRMDTTYVNRSNSNDKVFEAANRACPQGKPIQRFSETYRRRKLLLYQSIVKLHPRDPMKGVVMDPETLRPRTYEHKRVGRPRLNWAAETSREYWAAIQTFLPQHLKGRGLNFDNPRHAQAIREAAEANTVK